MYLNLVAQLPELGVDVNLLGFRFFPRPLELNQQRTTTGQPEDPVWVPRVARRNELGAYDPEVLPHEITGILLDLAFQLPHGSLCLSRHGAQTPLTNLADHSPQRSQSPGRPAGI